MTRLADHFKGVAVKRLRAVETTPKVSNQHEFNSSKLLRTFLGEEKRYIKANVIYLALNEEDRLSQESTLTWYDSRKNDPDRSAEFRLYYKANEAIYAASEGDILIAALRHDETMLLVVIPAESPQLDEVLWLFGIGSEQAQQRFTVIDTESASKPDALFYYIAEEAGLELEMPDRQDNWLDLLLGQFGPRFPSTRELSALARHTLNVDHPDYMTAHNDPDSALMSMLDREEDMFRQLERHIVGEYLEKNSASWTNDVDAFVKFSLGVHNRRKSRAGHALENHLEWIFHERRLKFERGVRTENRSKPDFLFPGQSYYHDMNWPASSLIMLGVKTTCKDRWRQVLNEAHRIKEKHLLTLQPGISTHQTEEMYDAGIVRLVVPKMLHSFYSPQQRNFFVISLQDFIQEEAEPLSY